MKTQTIFSLIFAILLVSSAYGDGKAQGGKQGGATCTNDQYTCTDGSCISMGKLCTGGAETDPCDDGTKFEAEGLCCCNPGGKAGFKQGGGSCEALEGDSTWCVSNGVELPGMPATPPAGGDGGGGGNQESCEGEFMCGDGGKTECVKWRFACTGAAESDPCGNGKLAEEPQMCCCSPEQIKSIFKKGGGVCENVVCDGGNEGDAGNKPEGGKDEGDKKEGDKDEGDKKEGDKKEGDRDEGDKKEGDKDEGDKKEGDKVEPVREPKKPNEQKLTYEALKSTGLASKKVEPNAQEGDFTCSGRDSVKNKKTKKCESFKSRMCPKKFRPVKSVCVNICDEKCPVEGFSDLPAKQQAACYEMCPQSCPAECRVEGGDCKLVINACLQVDDQKLEDLKELQRQGQYQNDAGEEMCVTCVEVTVADCVVSYVKDDVEMCKVCDQGFKPSADGTSCEAGSFDGVDCGEDGCNACRRGTVCDVDVNEAGFDENVKCNCVPTCSGGKRKVNVMKDKTMKATFEKKKAAYKTKMMENMKDVPDEQVDFQPSVDMGMEEFDVCVTCEGSDCEVNTKCEDGKFFSFGQCVDACPGDWSEQVTVKDVVGCVAKAGFYYDKTIKDGVACSEGCKYCKSGLFCEECETGTWQVMQDKKNSICLAVCNENAGMTKITIEVLNKDDKFTDVYKEGEKAPKKVANANDNGSSNQSQGSQGTPGAPGGGNSASGPNGDGQRVLAKQGESAGKKDYSKNMAELTKEQEKREKLESSPDCQKSKTSKACMSELDTIDGIVREDMLDLEKEDFEGYYRMENRAAPDFQGICMPCLKDCSSCSTGFILDEATKKCQAESDCDSDLGFEVKGGKCVAASVMKFRIKDKTSKKADELLGGSEKELAKTMQNMKKGKQQKSEMGFTDELFDEDKVEEDSKYTSAYEDLELEVEMNEKSVTNVEYKWEIVDEDQSEDVLNSVEGDWKTRMLKDVSVTGSKLKVPAVNRDDFSIMSQDQEDRQLDLELSLMEDAEDESYLESYEAEKEVTFRLTMKYTEDSEQKEMVVKQTVKFYQAKQMKLSCKVDDETFEDCQELVGESQQKVELGMDLRGQQFEAIFFALTPVTKDGLKDEVNDKTMSKDTLALDVKKANTAGKTKQVTKRDAKKVKEEMRKEKSQNFVEVSKKDLATAFESGDMVKRNVQLPVVEKETNFVVKVTLQSAKTEQYRYVLVTVLPLSQGQQREYQSLVKDKYNDLNDEEFATVDKDDLLDDFKTYAKLKKSTKPNAMKFKDKKPEKRYSLDGKEMAEEDVAAYDVKVKKYQKEQKSKNADKKKEREELEKGDKLLRKKKEVKVCTSDDDCTPAGSSETGACVLQEREKGDVYVCSCPPGFAGNKCDKTKAEKKEELDIMTAQFKEVKKRVENKEVSLDELNDMVESLLTVRVDEDGNEVAAQSELNPEFLSAVGDTVVALLEDSSVEMGETELDMMKDKLGRLEREFVDLQQQDYFADSEETSMQMQECEDAKVAPAPAPEVAPEVAPVRFLAEGDAPAPAPEVAPEVAPAPVSEDAAVTGKRTFKDGDCSKRTWSKDEKFNKIQDKENNRKLNDKMKKIRKLLQSREANDLLDQMKQDDSVTSKRKEFRDGEKVTTTVVTTKDKVVAAAADNDGKWKVYMAENTGTKSDSCTLSTADQRRLEVDGAGNNSNDVVVGNDDAVEPCVRPTYMQKSFCEIDVKEFEEGGALAGETDLRLAFSKGDNEESKDFVRCSDPENCKDLSDKEALVLTDDDMVDAKAGLNLGMQMLKADGSSVDTSKLKMKMNCEVWGWEGFEEGSYQNEEKGTIDNTGVKTKEVMEGVCTEEGSDENVRCTGLKLELDHWTTFNSVESSTVVDSGSTMLSVSLFLVLGYLSFYINE